MLLHQCCILVLIALACVLEYAAAFTTMAAPNMRHGQPAHSDNSLSTRASFFTTAALGTAASLLSVQALTQQPGAAAAAADTAFSSGSPAVGSKAPPFELPATSKAGDGNVSLAGLAGKWVILYFYPADGTSGCSIEAARFQKNLPEFKARNAEVLGMSLDDLASHRSFCSDLKLDFPLVADISGQVSSQYGALVKDPDYGVFTLRITFLIDPKGIIRYYWGKVTPARHADDVLAKLTALQETYKG